jgi:hypothetical protein
MWGGMGPLRERVRSSIDTVSQLLEHACLAPAPPTNAHTLASGGGEEGKTRSFVLKNGLYITFVLPLPYIDVLMFQVASCLCVCESVCVGMCRGRARGERLPCVCV